MVALVTTYSGCRWPLPVCWVFKPKHFIFSQSRFSQSQAKFFGPLSFFENVKKAWLMNWNCRFLETDFCLHRGRYLNEGGPEPTDKFHKRRVLLLCNLMALFLPGDVDWNGLWWCARPAATWATWACCTARAAPWKKPAVAERSWKEGPPPAPKAFNQKR